MPTKDDELVEVACTGCGRSTFFSPDEPPERQVCPFCTGVMPDACCEGCEDDGDHG